MEQYLDAVVRALGSVREQLTEWALPLAITAAAFVIAAALLMALRRDDLQRLISRSLFTRLAGGLAATLVVVICFSALRAANPVARQALEWRDSAEATLNPVGDAPGIYQYGPSVAAVKEKTYTRTLTLPPDFLERVGEQGIGVISPYLSDPSAENVLKLVDNFRRSGRDVIFTREVTRLDEEPLAFDSSKVSTRFSDWPGAHMISPSRAAIFSRTNHQTRSRHASSFHCRRREPSAISASRSAAKRSRSRTTPDSMSGRQTFPPESSARPSSDTMLPAGGPGTTISARSGAG